MIPLPYLNVFGTRLEWEIGDKRRGWTATSTGLALVNLIIILAGE